MRTATPTGEDRFSSPSGGSTVWILSNLRNDNATPFELNCELAVRIVHDIDCLAHQAAGKRRRIQQEHHAVVMQGQVLGDSALLPPGENLAQSRRGQLAVQVIGVLRLAPEPRVVIDHECRHPGVCCFDR